MAGINIHSASPLSSRSSDQSLSDAKGTLETQLGMIDSQSDTQTDVMEEVSLILESPEHSANQLHQASPMPSRPSPAARNVPRLKTGSPGAPLPWKIDETSSPYTPTSATRKASFVPPPRAGHRGSVGGATKLPPLQTATSPAQYKSYQFFTPSSNSSTDSRYTDLSHPPGYAQNDRASFSDRSPYENTTPFYQNSYSPSLPTPLTPTRRGCGILDNDPDLYLRGEGDADDETYWDTAAKWAKIAGKRLSQGEQQLWKMVNAVANGEGD